MQGNRPTDLTAMGHRFRHDRASSPPPPGVTVDANFRLRGATT